MEDFTVYILYSKSTDKYYIGHTADLHTRIRQHNDPYVTSHTSKLTLKNVPWELAYSENGFTSRAAAMKREKEIKGWKSRMMIQKLISSNTFETQ